MLGRSILLFTFTLASNHPTEMGPPSWRNSLWLRYSISSITPRPKNALMARWFHRDLETSEAFEDLAMSMSIPSAWAQAKISRHGFNWIMCLECFWNGFTSSSELLNYWATTHPRTHETLADLHPRDSHLLSFWHVLQGKVSNLCHGLIGIPTRSSNASFFGGITDMISPFTILWDFLDLI